MLKRVGCLALGLAVLLAATAVSAERGGVTNAPAPDGHIDVTVQFHLPVAVDRSDQEQARAQFEAARRRIYDIAASECGLLKATIATTCELRRFAIQSQVPPYASPQLPAGAVTGSATYRIKPKSF